MGCGTHFGSYTNWAKLKFFREYIDKVMKLLVKNHNKVTSMHGFIWQASYMTKPKIEKEQQKFNSRKIMVKYINVNKLKYKKLNRMFK